MAKAFAGHDHIDRDVSQAGPDFFRRSDIRKRRGLASRVDSAQPGSHQRLRRKRLAHRRQRTITSVVSSMRGFRPAKRRISQRM